MTAAPRRIDRAPETDRDAVLVAVRDALARLRYGAITLTVHDGRVVQLEVTDKRRFDI
jgi:hypothetical protein